MIKKIILKIKEKQYKKRWNQVTKWHFCNIKLMDTLYGKCDEHTSVYHGHAIDTVDTNIYNDLRKILKRLNIMEER